MARILISLFAAAMFIKLGSLIVTTKFLLIALGIACAALIALGCYAVWTRFRGAR
jgi:hypothetical protein